MAVLANGWPNDSAFWTDLLKIEKAWGARLGGLHDDDVWRALWIIERDRERRRGIPTLDEIISTAEPLRVTRIQAERAAEQAERTRVERGAHTQAMARGMTDDELRACTGSAGGIQCGWCVWEAERRYDVEQERKGVAHADRG